MSRCKDCHDQTVDRMVRCFACRQKWQDRRMGLYNEALAKYGPLSPDNLKMVQNHVKQGERIVGVKEKPQ